MMRLRRARGERPSRFSILLSVACVTVISPALRAATPVQVEAAIKNGKAFIYSKLNVNGNWETAGKPPTEAEMAVGNVNLDTTQYGGLTAMAVYALLSSGESYTDPRLKKAIDFLAQAEMRGTYALGVRAQIWPYLPPSPGLRQLVNEDAKRFAKGMFPKGKTEGLYYYYIFNKDFSKVDHSCSQYGVLAGMWACQRAGAEVSDRYWESIENAWIRDQLKSGGWQYTTPVKGNEQPTAAITAAGIATLFVTQDYLHSGEGVQCKGNINNKYIDAGLKWMGKNFDSVFATDALRVVYGLYGVERIGVASGLKYFGSVDWYQRGAEYLVSHQQADGHWEGVQAADVGGTAFALIFLARGRAPVVMNKLQYNIGGKLAHWNQRPRDAANVVKFIAKQIEKDLNWQSVTLDVPVEELHDAPILYLAGDEALNFTEAEKQKLREFCEEGGLILGNADCNRGDFATSFRKLSQTLFNTYEMRDLPTDSPIFTKEQFPRSKWPNKPKITGMSNGVREMMLLVNSGDPSMHWHQNEVVGHEGSFEMMDDIFLYAVDKQNLRTKGETYIVTLDPKINARQTIKMARLQYEGNWNPEPGGWRRMKAVLNNTANTALDVSSVKLGEGKLDPATYKVAHLTGTVKFTLRQVERDELKKFLDAGGTLIVDSAGGSSEFATAAEAELSQLYPDASKQLTDPLPPADAMYAVSGQRIEPGTIGYRDFARAVLGGNLKTAQIRAIHTGAHVSVYYSREDLSNGIVGAPVDGVIGYDPASATALMRNMLLYSTFQNPAK